MTVLRIWVTCKVFGLEGCQIHIKYQTNDRGFFFIMILIAFLCVLHLHHSNMNTKQLNLCLRTGRTWFSGIDGDGLIVKLDDFSDLF